MADFVGTADNDRLVGTGADDTFQGLAGNDTLIGGDGVDTALYDLRIAGAGVVLDGSVVGMATAVAIGDGEGGTDRLEGIEQLHALGSIHADAFTGGTGNDTFWGAVGNDTLDGAAGNDSVDGYQGDDSLLGGTGDDWLRGDAGNDTLLGGDGFDTAFEEFSLATAGVWYDASAVGTAALVDVADGRGDIDRVGGIERLWIKGSPHDDRLDGGATGDQLWGAAGNDTLSGGAGDDWLHGDDGADTARFTGNHADYTIEYDEVDHRLTIIDRVAGRDGSDRVDGVEFLQFADGTRTAESAAARRLDGAEGNDLLEGSGANDTLRGLQGDDTLQGKGGADLLEGGAGKDWLDGGSGSDTLIGGEGVDAAMYDFWGADASIVVDGSAVGTQAVVDIDGGQAGTDRLEGIECLWLVGSSHADTLIGGAGDDSIGGEDQDDLLVGGAGDDWFGGDAGNDTLIGGDGVDTGYYEFGAAAAGVVFDGSALGAATVVDIGDGQGGTDRLQEIERLWVQGWDLDDSLSGGAGADSLFGADGNDTLAGGGGDDSISGEDGIDTVVFSGNFAEYTIDFDDAIGRFTATDGVPRRDGTDRAEGVEYLRFADVTHAAASFAARQVVGTDADEMLLGGKGDDTLIGGAGNDTLFAYEGRDSLSGGDGDDWLAANAGNDLLAGDAGDDNLLGGAGDDTLHGGGGDDNVRGDGGSDTVVFSGAFDEYEVTFDMVYDRFTIRDRVAGRDGTDMVREAEWLQFSDGVRTAEEVMEGRSTPDLRVPDPSALPYFIRGVYLHQPYGDVGTGQTIRYSFPTSALPDMIGFAPYSTAQQAVVREALDKFSAVAGLRFEQVADDDGSARLRFFRAQIDEAGTGGWGVVTIKNTNALDSFDSNAFLLQHEIGHTLGLRHPFGDEWTWLEGQTVMSYAQEERLGPYDLAALHYLYGCNPDARIGDDVYQFSDRYVWDGGGVDTFSAATATDAVCIDLSPGGWSWAGAKSPDLMDPGQAFIGVDSWIEDAIGAAGADRIAGNALANRIEGGGGDDTWIGGAGDDALVGGNGVDSAGYDFSGAGAGIRFDGAACGTAAVVVMSDGLGGWDRLEGIEGLVLNGSPHDDTLLGGAGNDLLSGSNGADLLSGGVGSDTLSGGAGLDVADYRGGTAVDADLATGIATHGADADSLVDIEAIFGSSGGDVLRGIDGPVKPGETFRGGAGNDRLFGGTGTDTAEFLGNLADYTISRTPGTLEITVMHNSGGADGSDSLREIEHLLFADRLVCFGPRAEDVARVAFALWSPRIVDSAMLFSKGMSFYDNEHGYSFDVLCEVVLQWHPETGLALANKLKTSIPAIAYSEAQLLDVMNANGGGDSASGRAAAVKAVALDPATTVQLELMGVMSHGLVATHNFDAEVYFGFLPG